MESDEKVLSKLKFIGKLKKGDKINVQYQYIQPDGIITRVSRSVIYPDNRGNTLNFVRTTIHESFQILEKYLESKYPSDIFRVNNIIDDMKGAKFGMINLKETYIGDSKFGCDVDILLQDIDARLIKIKNNLGTDQNERKQNEKKQN